MTVVSSLEASRGEYPFLLLAGMSKLPAQRLYHPSRADMHYEGAELHWTGRCFSYAAYAEIAAAWQ